MFTRTIELRNHKYHDLLVYSASEYHGIKSIIINYTMSFNRSFKFDMTNKSTMEHGILTTLFLHISHYVFHGGILFHFFDVVSCASSLIINTSQSLTHYCLTGTFFLAVPKF